MAKDNGEGFADYKNSYSLLLLLPTWLLVLALPREGPSETGETFRSFQQI